jgi:uncharacterized protein (DUF2062 family)
MASKPMHLKIAIARALRQGTTPRGLALTCALGVVIGMFPIFGTTTLLCFAVAFILRLNVPLIQLVNYVTTPLQLIMMVWFIKIGTSFFGMSPFPYDPTSLVSAFREDYWSVLREAGIALLAAAGVWSVCAIPIFFTVFIPSLWLFQKWRSTGQRALKSQ